MKRRFFYKESNQLVRLMEIAIMTSLALVLDYLSGLFLRMPNGGSLALIMIPVILMSIRWGISTGFYHWRAYCRPSVANEWPYYRYTSSRISRLFRRICCHFPKRPIFWID
ncbi:energy-coupled thiamine transporter ThiT [Bacillus sp. SL00103]